MTLLTLIIYLALQLGICIYIAKKIDTESDYLVAGRQFPLVVVSLSLFATWFGAETCIGSSGAVFANGLSGSRADPFGYSICLFLSGLLIAGKIWNTKYMTLSDFYRDRYGRVVEQMAVWILSISSLIWAAAQLRAFGQVLVASANLDFDVALFVGFIFVIGYTLLGGLMGDMITDVVQAVVIVFGLGLLLVTVIYQNPNFFESLKDIPLERLSLIGKNESWLARIDRWAVPILGSLVAQEIVSRMFAAKTKRIAVRACYYGGLIYLLVGMIPVLLGLVGPNLISIEGDSEQFLIQLAKSNLSPVAVGIFSGAIISALLATIDSILLAVGALVSHNFLIPILKIKSEKKKLIISRMVVLTAGLAAYSLAMHSEGIYQLLEVASSFGTAGILVITLLGLWTKFGSTASAVAALIVGVIANPIAERIFHSESPFLFSILFATITYMIFSFRRIKSGKQSLRHECI